MENRPCLGADHITFLGEGRGGERDWKILKQNVQGRTILLFRGGG